MSVRFREGWLPLVLAMALALTIASPALAADPAHGWSRSVIGTFYLYPHDDNFLQPTVLADRGRLHLEARYNYEDRNSVSGFVGANFEMGDEVALTVTPMIGAVVGRTDGIVPAAELSLAWRRFEAYAEAEYVLGVGADASDYFYMWTEASLWARDWLRAGFVSQRTRVYHSEREVEPGILAGTRLGIVDATVSVFSPGSDESFTLLSIGVEF